MIKKFTGSTTQGGDNFGVSVTLYHGEYVVVGAPGKGANIGATYVYFRNQGGADTFGEAAVIGSSLSANNNYYGTTVTISSDWVVVGANRAGDGQAYVYRRTFVYLSQCCVCFCVCSACFLRLCAFACCLGVLTDRVCCISCAGGCNPGYYELDSVCVACPQVRVSVCPSATHDV